MIVVLYVYYDRKAWPFFAVSFIRFCAMILFDINLRIQEKKEYYV